MADATVTDPDADDAADVRGALAGDGAAFARIVRRHQGAVAARMWRFTRDRLQHEELVQDVFVEAWRSLRSYRGTGALAHWIGRIAVRVGYRFWRTSDRRRRVKPLGDAQIEALGGDPANSSAAEAAELVHAALAQLSPRDRLVVTLLHLEEHSVREVAELTGWSRSMVKVQAWRARKKLEKLLSGGEES
jgi:RNA polymerase sigma-70 factor, ECF subfamily